MSYYFPSNFYGSSNVMRARIYKSQEKYVPQKTSTVKNSKTEVSAPANTRKPKIVLDDNTQTTTLKKIGIGIGAAILAYSARNIIGACMRGLKNGGVAFKNFLSNHTKGSIHEALGGVYHTVAGTGKVLTSPIRGISKLISKVHKP